MALHVTLSTALRAGAPNASTPRRARRCARPSSLAARLPSGMSGERDRQARAVRLRAVRPQRPWRGAADHPAVDLVARVMTGAVEGLPECVVCNSALLVCAQCIHRDEPAVVHAGDDDRVCSTGDLAEERAADLDEHRVILDAYDDRIV